MAEERLCWSVPSPLRTGVTTRWPWLCSKGANRSHVPVDCHAPWTRTNVAIAESLAGWNVPCSSEARCSTLEDHAYILVGTARFELATPCTPSKCATRLRYVPT